jgi:23S rRNA (uridine2552-2'-O)-methyltransferase
VARRSGSSQRWRARQQRDIYVDQANREGWRSRAVFKLEQIQAKERLLAPGAKVVDLGSSPGSWSQLAASIVGPAGRVWAVDVLPMDAIPGVEFLLGDFTSVETRTRLAESIGTEKVDLVMSDMAPNISGNRVVDQARTIGLLDDALALAREVLRPGGHCLMKAFQGEGIEQLRSTLRAEYSAVKLLKPKASRAESREIYLLARNYGM